MALASRPPSSRSSAGLPSGSATGEAPGRIVGLLPAELQTNLTAARRGSIERAAKRAPAGEGPGADKAPPPPVAGSAGSERPIRGDRWELGPLLKSGGQARIWEARDLMDRSREPVVLKEPLPHVSDGSERLAREAEALRRVDGARFVPKLVDYRSSPDGGFIVMTRAVGSLADEYQSRVAPAAEIRLIFTHACLGLLAAYAAGVIAHRDIALENLLRAYDGRVLVADFGIALMRGVDVGLTPMGISLGRAQYRAPDLATGAEASEATDTYALGVAGSKLATGRFPVVGETLPPGAADPALRALIADCMDPDPVGRPTMRQILGRLDPEATEMLV